MRARHGESVLLDGEGIACPAAASAFSFRPLPEGLASGKGLVGFGIVQDPATGRTMFEGMTRLAPGSTWALLACPLARAPALPDVVVVEGPAEALMWIALADLNVAGGARRHGRAPGDLRGRRGDSLRGAAAELLAWLLRMPRGDRPRRRRDRAGLSGRAARRHRFGPESLGGKGHSAFAGQGGVPASAEEGPIPWLG